MDKFQNQYRIPSTRLQNWDYGWNGAYFITICTENRNHYFGEIAEGKLMFSEIGLIAEKYWLEIPGNFPYAKLDVHVVMPNHVHGIIIIDKPDGGCGIGTNEKTKCDKYNDTNDGVDGALGDGTNDGPNDETNHGPNDGTNVETRLIASLQRTPQSPPQSPPQRTPQSPPQSPSPPVPPSIPQPVQPPASPPKTGGFAGNKNPMINENVSRIIRWYKGRCSFEIGKIHTCFGWQSRLYDHIIRDDASLQRIRNYIINNPNNWKEDRFFL